MTKTEISLLENDLNHILIDPDNDGTFGTDGSYEALANAFDRAWDKADEIARKAISALKEVA